MKNTIVTFAIGIALLLASPRNSQASFIVGSGGLVSQAYGDQLETWLGEGPITITNVFTKQSGSTSFNFHAAADGRGRTFSVIEVFGPNTATQVIGGYNPQSWSSNNLYNISPNLGDRTAFIFNLTSNEKQNQNQTISNVYYDSGVYQTYNYIGYGPTFGGGHDIHVAGGLDSGYAYNYSYGETVLADAITIGGSNYDNFNIGRIEVYTISNGIETSVPEPATMVLWGVGALGMGLVARRRAKKATAV